MPNFSDIFIAGSRNYKKTSVEEHATKCKPHARAMEFHFKSKGMSLEERAKKISSSVAPKNTDIISGVSIMDERDLELTKRKFQVAYFVAKHQLSMTKYAEILKLEEIHSVEIGEAYRTGRYCGTFIDYCSDDIKSLLNSDLCDANFYSVLSDGSTDSAVKENEVIYVLYFDPTPIGSDSVEVKVLFLQMNYLQVCYRCKSCY